jgi:hypothetical protein
VESGHDRTYADTGALETFAFSAVGVEGHGVEKELGVGRPRR